MGVFKVAQGGESTDNESCCSWKNECVNLEDLRFNHHGLNEGNKAEAVSGQGRQAADSTIRLSHLST